MFVPASASPLVGDLSRLAEAVCAVAASMTPYLTEDEVRERLRRKVAELGSQQKLADIAGCSHTLVSRILTTNAPVGPRIAQALGLIAIPVRSYQYLPREDGAQ